jgi:GMP synthase (glutamine-hydrolysing)
MQHQKILILDFGSQVTQLIARRVREAHVFCEVHPCDVSDDWVRQYAADGQLKGIILSGSHASVYEDTTDKAPQAVFELGCRCWASATACRPWPSNWAARSKAATSANSALPKCARPHPLLEGIQDFATPEGHGMLKVWMSHGDKVTELPPGFKLMASTASCPIAGMADEARATPCSSTRSHAHRAGRGAAAALRAGHLRRAPTGSWATTSRGGRQDPRAGGRRGVILGLSGGVDSSWLPR